MCFRCSGALGWPGGPLPCVGCGQESLASQIYPRIRLSVGCFVLVTLDLHSPFGLVYKQAVPGNAFLIFRILYAAERL